jgi:predicted peptidase
MEALSLGKLRYVIRYPEGFSENKRYPVIVFLHGAGTRGDDMSRLISHPFFVLTEKHENFPFLCVAPLCTENTWFDLWEHLEGLIAQIAQLPFADQSRIYLTGASMGGYAAWQLAMSLPEYFAALVPVCGGGMYWNAKRLVDIPVWAFHGAKDRNVLLEESVKMVEAVNRRGGDAKLTVYPENEHDAWSDTYSNPDVFAWLLQHQKKNGESSVDEYNNTAVYG